MYVYVYATTLKKYIFSWQRLSSKVTLTHDNLPQNIRIGYIPKCDHPGPPGEKEGVCDNVRAGQKVSCYVFIYFFNTI